MEAVQDLVSSVMDTVTSYGAQIHPKLGDPTTAAVTLGLTSATLYYLLAKRNPYKNVPQKQYDDNTPDRLHGGDLVAEVLKRHGVEQVFTLIGGHISPMLVGCKRRGIRCIDVRHEVTTVFAADAVSRLTGVPGVAMVTAGPGVTNTITAVKNAQMAQSPLVLFGGATAGLLKGRGSLQDIDQMALLRPIVKYCVSISRTDQIVPTIEKAFQIAQSGVPGPVFIETPIDLLYPEEFIRKELGNFKSKGSSPIVKIENFVVQSYLDWYANRLYRGLHTYRVPKPLPLSIPFASDSEVKKVAALLRKAKRPVMLVGSQAMVRPQFSDDLQRAVFQLGIPTYLSSAARGLLGRESDIQMRHKRRDALKEADLVILAGCVMDFRLQYGRAITRNATLVSVNRSTYDLTLNRTPEVPIHGDPSDMLIRLANTATDVSKTNFSDWYTTLRKREDARNADILKSAEDVPKEYINPIKLCLLLEEALGDDDIMVADGGDFVGTASYTTKPRAPCSWLDPGAFGTLGVGGGFAMGAKLAKPDRVVWILYGDGSCGYSVAEFDTYMRHNIPVIALVGNDACWSQIYRDQIKVFKDDVACNLAYTPYEDVAKGFGGEGLVVSTTADIKAALAKARKTALSGKPVLLNAKIAKSSFREGSISV